MLYILSSDMSGVFTASFSINTEKTKNNNNLKKIINNEQLEQNHFIIIPNLIRNWMNKFYVFFASFNSY